MTTIAYQLYCSRNFPPLDDTLAMLAGVGFTAVEGYGGLYEDLEGFKAALDRNGLTMPSGHYGIDLVEGDPDRAIAIAKTLGSQKIIVPYLQAPDRPSDKAGWADFAARLVRIGAPIKDAGLVFAWHNHEFELVDLGGGETPMDLIAAAGVDIELDLGWVFVAGQDPVTLLRRYGAQVTAVHVKDRAAAGTLAEDGWADVGHGVIDWTPIRAALAAGGIDHLVLEHDNPADHTRFAANSLLTVKGW